MASNPLPFFIEKFCNQNSYGYMRYSYLYQIYTKFLKYNKKRIISKKEFSKVLISEGYENRKTSKEGNIDYYVEGIELKENFPDFPDFHKSILHFSMYKNEYGKRGNQGNQGNEDEGTIVPEEMVVDIIEKARKGELK